MISDEVKLANLKAKLIDKVCKVCKESNYAIFMNSWAWRGRYISKAAYHCSTCKERLIQGFCTTEKQYKRRMDKLHASKADGSDYYLQRLAVSQRSREELKPYYVINVVRAAIQRNELPVPDVIPQELVKAYREYLLILRSLPHATRKITKDTSPSHT